jgi:hypothetical protein
MNTGSWFSTSLDLNDCFFLNAGHLLKAFPQHDFNHNWI